MTIKYELNKDIVARVATQLNFSLNTIKDSIFIIKNERCFNGKSLIGILANNLKKGEIIEIKASDKDILNIREIFNKVGKEVK
jgi:phosphotransferase system HPr-like phosphotransfer protein